MTYFLNALKRRGTTEKKIERERILIGDRGTVRQILELAANAGGSGAEVSKLTNVSRNTVKDHIAAD